VFRSVTHLNNTHLCPHTHRKVNGFFRRRLSPHFFSNTPSTGTDDFQISYNNNNNNQRRQKISHCRLVSWSVHLLLAQPRFLLSVGMYPHIRMAMGMSYVINQCCVNLDLQSTAISFKCYTFSYPISLKYISKMLEGVRLWNEF